MLLFLLVILMTSSCNTETRASGRQKRLDTFRASLPDNVRTEFDAISGREDCDHVGLLLEGARDEFQNVNSTLDSIVNAELIDSGDLRHQMSGENAPPSRRASVRGRENRS